ncbi:hypothetical protein BC940DRAFT_312552 [Gongronella butleri]|nr:hypothetical protein BC940DRAFT_312552 [Gongronella butleri]
MTSKNGGSTFFLAVRKNRNTMLAGWHGFDRPLPKAFSRRHILPPPPTGWGRLASSARPLFKGPTFSWSGIGDHNGPIG